MQIFSGILCLIFIIGIESFVISRTTCFLTDCSHLNIEINIVMIATGVLCIIIYIALFLHVKHILKTVKDDFQIHPSIQHDI